MYDFILFLQSTPLTLHPPNLTVNDRGSQKEKLFEGTKKKPGFPLDLRFYDFKIVNVYRYGQLQGQENCDFTNVTTLTALVILG